MESRGPGSRSGIGRQDNGQGLVEFALTVPVAMLIILALVELSFAFNAYITLIHATEAGARAGAVYDFNSTYTKSVNDSNRVSGNTQSSGIPQYTENVRDTVAANLNFLNNSNFDKATDVTITYKNLVAPPYDHHYGDQIEVATKYTYPWLTGFLSSVPITLRAQASARVEPN